MNYHIINIEDIKTLIKFAEGHFEHLPSDSPGRKETLAYYIPEYDVEKTSFEWRGEPIQKVSEATRRLKACLEHEVDPFPLN